MPNYRRAFVPGGCWFFTVNLADRRRSDLVDQIEALRASVDTTRRKFPFEIDAFVVLPDHLHTVWTLPSGDADFPLRWRLIKMRFAKALPRSERIDAVRSARGERGVWQRRYWEHLIRDERDYAVTSNIARSTRSSTGWCRACETGRIRLSIATCVVDCFRSTG